MEIKEKINLLCEQENWETVILLAEKHKDKIKQDKESLFNVGISYFKLEKYKESIVFFKLCLKKDPLDQAAIIFLSEALMEINLEQEAKMHLLQLLATQDSYICRIHLAMIYQNQQEYYIAEAIHKEGIRLQPNHRERLEAYSDFLSDIGRQKESERYQREASVLETREQRKNNKKS